VLYCRMTCGSWINNNSTESSQCLINALSQHLPKWKKPRCVIIPSILAKLWNKYLLHQVSGISPTSTWSVRLNTTSYECIHRTHKYKLSTNILHLKMQNIIRYSTMQTDENLLTFHRNLILSPFYPEDEGNRRLLNSGQYLLDCPAPHSTTLQ
jgi:hypothetical protein